jgi:uncharacterized protein with FMN-binding domain
VKKLILSFFVIGAFLFYSVHEKQESAEVTISTTNRPSDTPPPALSGTDSSQVPITTSLNRQYRDGVFTGKSADAFYGFIQVRVTVQNGKIADVEFLDYPSDRSTSRIINEQAGPLLKSEAIQIQSAQVDIVSGATDSSLAFRESLQSALDQAK